MPGMYPSARSASPLSSLRASSAQWARPPAICRCGLSHMCEQRRQQTLRRLASVMQMRNCASREPGRNLRHPSRFAATARALRAPVRALPARRAWVPCLRNMRTNNGSRTSRLGLAGIRSPSGWTEVQALSRPGNSSRLRINYRKYRGDFEFGARDMVRILQSNEGYGQDIGYVDRVTMQPYGCVISERTSIRCFIKGGSIGGVTRVRARNRSCSCGIDCQAQNVPIAGVVELTGAGATARGTNFDNGVKLAVREINAAGGLNAGRWITRLRNTQTNPDVAEKRLRRRPIESKCLRVVIGPVFSGIHP